MLEAGRYHVTIYLSDKIEGFIIDLYHWLEVVDAPAPVLDLTDLGQLSQPIEAELTRNNALTPQTQELLRLIIGRAVPDESFSLASIWAGNPDTLRNVERVRAARQQLPLLTGLLAVAVFLTALLILLLGSGWGSRLRGARSGAAPGRDGNGRAGAAADHRAQWPDRDTGTNMASNGRHEVRRISSTQLGARRRHHRRHWGAGPARRHRHILRRSGIHCR